MNDDYFEAGDEMVIGDKLKASAARSVDERSEALYHYLVDLCEKAANNGHDKLKIYATHDTAALFKDTRIYNKVYKRCKEQRLYMKYRETTLWRERSFILITW